MTRNTLVQVLAGRIDGFFHEQLEELAIPGAVFSLSDRSGLLLGGSYGQAVIEEDKAFDSSVTVVRAGSVSKLFTATAVMQLAEQGRLDLNRDINEYFQDIHVRTQFATPLTAAHLLTHTSGFNEKFIGGHVADPRRVLPLGEYLLRRMPTQALPPGTIISYNDHAITLAGHLVEAISGMRFSDYVREHIFEPLEMWRSTFEQPPEPRLETDLATGYKRRRGGFRPYSLDYMNIAPAASLLTTAEDMAHFMAAHLNEGRYGSTRILEEETARTMRRRQFTHHPLLRGRAFGFSEWFEHGLRAVFHDGGNPGFINRMMLLPELDLGFFMCCNGDQQDGATKLPRRLTTFLLESLAEETGGRPMPSKAGGTSASHETESTSAGPDFLIAGRYRSLHGHARKTIEKVFALAGETRVKRHGADGVSWAKTRYERIGPRVFRSMDGDKHIAFRGESNPRATYLLVGTMAYRRLKWWETRIAHAMAAMFCLVAFLGGLAATSLPGLGWTSTTSGAIKLALLRAVCGIGLLCVAGLVLTVRAFRADWWPFFHRVPVGVRWLLALPAATGALTVAGAVLLVRSAMNAALPLVPGVIGGVILLAGALFACLSRYWNVWPGCIHQRASGVETVRRRSKGKERRP